jgi:hypothetical protein
VVGGEAMDGLMITNQNGESINLGNEVPYFLQILEGASEVPVTIENQKAPKQDGSTYFDSTLENRAITIEGMIVTKNNPSSVKEARRKMQRVLNPKLGEVTITYQGKEIKGIVENTPTFPSGDGNKGIYYQKYLINLLCHQPFWLEPFYESREMAAFIGGLEFPIELDPYMMFEESGQNITVENLGDVPTPVEIEFNGPALNPEVGNLTTGEFIRIKREIFAGDKLLINTEFGNKRVVILHEDGTEENAFNWIDLDSIFWELKVGENEISYKADSGEESATVLIKWRNRYVGI